MSETQRAVTPNPATPRKRLHVITWGCQMNVYDSAPDGRRAGAAGLCPGRRRPRAPTW